MKNAPIPTKQEILDLLAFYPVLCADGFNPFSKQEVTLSLPEGGFHPSSSEYHPAVVDFLISWRKSAGWTMLIVLSRPSGF